MTAGDEEGNLTVCERALSVSDRKLSSMLELGRIIGLDLDIDDMLITIAQKAREVMEADRFNLFLYDPITEELRTRILLEIEGKECRIPVGMGIAGYAFRTRQTVIVDDVRKDPRFFSYIDEVSGYTTRSMLCMPFFSRSGDPLGVMQLINKIQGNFTADDETLLTMFTNHASVFIEIAQLQKARLESLEQSRKDLERLNTAKGKALDHLSHELKTPLAVIQGYLRIIRRKIEKLTGDISFADHFETVQRYMERLFEIQKECERIIQAYRETEQGSLADELEGLWKKLEALHMEIPLGLKDLWHSLERYVAAYVPPGSGSESIIIVYPAVEKAVADTRGNAPHRDIEFALTGDETAAILMDAVVLKDILMGLLKNAVENTPDGGQVEVNIRHDRESVFINVTDHGTGITETNQPHIFEGFFHTQNTDLYGSRNVYDFGAGGKGLDLFQMKAYARRFGFDISMTSVRCIHIPTDSDICPGKISLCPHISRPEDCAGSGTTTFYLTFPISKEYLKIEGNPIPGARIEGLKK
jgi:signal transduction histidine kinase